MKVFKCLILSDQSSKTPKYSVNDDIKEKKSETFETEMIILDSTFQLRFVSGFFFKNVFYLNRQTDDVTTLQMK